MSKLRRRQADRCTLARGMGHNREPCPLQVNEPTNGAAPVRDPAALIKAKTPTCNREVFPPEHMSSLCSGGSSRIALLRFEFQSLRSAGASMSLSRIRFKDVVFDIKRELQSQGTAAWMEGRPVFGDGPAPRYHFPGR